MARAGLYVHIPFCRSKCSYCDFVSFAGRSALHEPYVAALVQEAAARAPAWEPYDFDTLFVGGGTPTLLSPATLAHLIATCRDALTLDAAAEVTVEANPSTVHCDALLALRAVGVTRLSLGVQSFDDGLLRLLGRVHSAAEAVATVTAARAVGIDNLNLDLIYGLPTQTLAQWHATLHTAVALNPQHLSLYGLSVEEGTLLEERIASGACPAPDDELAAQMYEMAEELLDSAGYAHYEISNWALRSPGDPGDDDAPPALACRHNLGYWRNEAYLGLGVAAHSYDLRCRTANTTDLEDYLARLRAGEAATVSNEPTDRARELGETMMLGLRLVSGVSWEAFEARFGIGLLSIYAREVQALCDDGLLAVDARGIRLTRTGRLLGNRVFAQFLR